MMIFFVSVIPLELIRQEYNTEGKSRASNDTLRSPDAIISFATMAASFPKGPTMRTTTKASNSVMRACLYQVI